MALLVRERTGRGQCIDAALYECAFSFMEPHVPAFEKLGVVAMRAASRLPGNAPNNLYVAKDGQFIHVTAGNDAVFRRLAQLMGRPDLVENIQFRTAIARADHMDDLDDIISDWACQHDAEELERRLNAADIPASRIYTIANIFKDPHYQAREMLVRVADDDLTSVTLAAVVPKLSETPGRIRYCGRRIGQDSQRVFADLVGLSEIEIRHLAEQGVIGLDHPIATPTA
jgi:crotonobetainyl-CoA:carnitine CoA-transferase CaiB-like acyl-CoA transferase